MGKLIVPVLALAVVGVAAWLLLSKDETPRTPKIQPAASSSASDAPTSAASNAVTPRARRPIVKNALPKRRKMERPKSGVAGVAPRGTGPSAANTPAAAPPSARPILKQPLLTVQASVRQFYGNLPKSGAVPGRVTLEEVLPAGVIEQLGAPSNAEITMLGPFSIKEARAFKDVLEMDQRYDTMLGVTWRREDGTEARDYVALTAPGKPSP